MENVDFRAIVERLPLVVYVDELDQHSSARYVSTAIEQLLGYTAAEWLAQPTLFVDRIHPDDRERVLAEIDTRNGQGISEQSDYRLLHRDGSIVWVRDEEVVVPGSAGRPAHVQGYLQDVTDRREDRNRLELLARILQLGAADPSPAELIEEAGELLAAAVGNVTVTYVELGAENTLLPRSTTCLHGLPAELPVIPATLEPLVRGPLVIDDVLLEPWLEPAWPLLRERGVRAAVDIPLLRDGRVTAVVWFNAPEPRHWTDAEIQTLTEVTAQLGITLERAEARAERARADEDLRRRDAMLEAVTFCAEALLSHPTWSDAAAELLERLGRALGASRAYIFENHDDETGGVRTSQRCEWVAEGVTAELDNPVMQGMSFADVGLDRLVELSLRNETYGGKVDDLPPQERLLYEDQNILSVLSVPIFVEDGWWGFIGFDDCVDAREWTPAETDTLRIAATLVAAAISRERAEAVLREHEQKLRAVFETALDAIFITSDDRRYVDANPAGCELLGIAKRDLIGRRIDDFMPPERRATVEEDWVAFRSSDQVVEEWESLRSDGEIRQVEAAARPGFLPGLNIAFLRDVTDRKRLETELLNAQKLESIGRLAGGVAHDFNNLLTAIGGYTALLLERAGTDPVFAHDLEQIARATDRAGELTRQLLAFGRRQVLQPRVLDLNETLAGVGSLLRRLLGEHVELVLLPAPRPATVRADPGQLEQVIVNLAVNARDAMPAGGRLTLSIVATEDDEGAFVELRAADTGVGMDDATLEKVFEPFFTTREQGVGLGLASVHGIVSQSGGDVGVTSTPGLGSTFAVRLPRVGEVVEPVAAPHGAVQTGTETILLVEDEDVVRALALRVLERSGYVVLACANGSEAIEVAERHELPIDLLLTDVVMPGLRGHEVAERVASTRPGIKVLYMSGYADEALLGRAAIAGTALIEKPFEVAALARRVREALESD